MRHWRDRGRFVAACVVGAALVVGATAAAALIGLGSDGARSADAAQGGDADGDATPSSVTPADGAADLLPDDGLVVRATHPEDERAPGRLVRVTADGTEPVGDLECARVHVSSEGPGLCLTVNEAGYGYQGVVFDGDQEATLRFALPGTPDRTRVSEDGRFGAFTVFDSGESSGYAANSDDFTTYSTILELDGGRPLLHLEELEVTRDGEPFDADAGNFWGVTFLGDTRFYATLGVGLDTYLVEGDWETGAAEIVREEIECPSISPDGERIAYKKRIGKRENWRIHVLELDSGDDVALAGDVSIDDQPEWLDDDHVVYSDGEDVIVADADGEGDARPLVRGAASPAAPR